MKIIEKTYRFKCYVFSLVTRFQCSLIFLPDYCEALKKPGLKITFLKILNNFNLCYTGHTCRAIVTDNRREPIKYLKKAHMLIRAAHLFNKAAHMLK